MDKRQKIKDTFFMPVIGISSLLVIFSVLCLTVFAMLSVSTVKAGQTLADRTLAQTVSYYEADGEAEKILCQLRMGQVPEGVEVSGTDESGKTVYRYTCPLSETQNLEIAAAVEGTEYRILRWQLVSSADWQAEENLDLWDGE